MTAFLAYLKRSFRRLALILAFFCALEIFIHLTDGTIPNYRFPWGHYCESIAVLGLMMLLVAYLLREKQHIPKL